MSCPAPPFPWPPPDDDGGPPPSEPEWYGLTAQPAADGEAHRVQCARALGADPYGPTESYCGGSMRRRPGIDDEDR